MTYASLASLGSDHANLLIINELAFKIARFFAYNRAFSRKNEPFKHAHGSRFH
jgi:hypothetical protein